MKAAKIKLGLLLTLSLLINDLSAQYFGRNKAKYKKFDFEVFESPHFEIYHYLGNDSTILTLGQQAEQWYRLHQAILQDTFDHKNPIVFYNNHPDFQQTNTISGNISVGTGGVTEGFKNRVIMPLTYSNEQTNHVLGHELVHAFQFHMVIDGDSTSIRNLSNIPLFIIEGLAEYLSIGRVDAHTAMWMRDAVLNDDIPKIKDLYNPKYFPYRWGQTFWAFITGKYGDQVIRPYFMAIAKHGLEAATKKILKTDLKSLSDQWQSSLESYYKGLMKRNNEQTIGKKLLSDENAGRMNVSPVLSPNGRHVIFLSEKDLFSLDLFLADARTGKIIRKVASTTKDGHIDDFNYLESAGTWSPNSKQFAFVVFSKGMNKLVIKDVSNGKTVKEFAIPDVPAFSQPAWSPDGKTIVVTGLVDGQADLYSYNLKKGTVQQLTNDIYSNLQPNWSLDGTQITYATDRLSMQRGRSHGKWTSNIAILDIEKETDTDLEIFLGANNLNPVYDHEGNILFLSDRDGYRNMYKYDTSESSVIKLTNFLTGISGITKYSPAISASRKRDRVLFTHYYKNSYAIYQSPQEKLNAESIPVDSVNMAAARLPIINPEIKDIVNGNLNKLDHLNPVDHNHFQEKAYKPKFKLDYIGGNAGVGVATGRTTFGNNSALAGGVDMLFSDILGDHQLYTGLALNGELRDLGGQVTYINRKNRIAWGGSLSHTSFRSGFSSFPVRDFLPIEGSNESIPVQRVDLNLQRVFQQRAGIFAHLPLSKTKRFEAGASYSRFSFRNDVQSFYYDLNGFFLGATNREKVDNAPPAFNLYNVNAAFVGDNSYFGIASPLAGSRFRIGVERFFGDANFYSTTVDYRKYQYLRPVSIAFRGLHFARYGDSDALPGLYAGDPVFVRGYGFNSINQTLQENELSFNQLIGSKLFVGNFEVRLPFTGPEKLSAIKSKFFFSELAFFVDGGVAFNEFSDFSSADDDPFTSLKPKPIFSTGLSMRINVLGAFIIEPYYAIPLQKNTRGVFGINIVPGW